MASSIADADATGVELRLIEPIIVSTNFVIDASKAYLKKGVK